MHFGIIVYQNSTSARRKTNQIIHEAIISTSLQCDSSLGAIIITNQISNIVSLPQSTCASFHLMKCSMKLPTHGTSYYTDAHSKRQWSMLILNRHAILVLPHAGSYSHMLVHKQNTHYQCTVSHKDTHNAHTQISHFPLS